MIGAKNVYKYCMVTGKIPPPFPPGKFWEFSRGGELSEGGVFLEPYCVYAARFRK